MNLRELTLLQVSSLPSSDIMPGYTASHSACKKTTNLRTKFCGKTALNGEILHGLDFGFLSSFLS